MTDNVFYNVALPKQAKEVRTEEVENLIRTEAEMKRSILLGVAYGAIAGFLMGLGQMVFLGPTIWSMWGAAAIPIFNAGCWALIGSIVGCGGILGSKKAERK